jgi:predicted nucleic acid-binding protein
VILLDTNVASEAMRSVPERKVLAWLNDQESSSLYFSTISMAEIAYGLRILPDGRRRVDLRERFEHFVGRAFAERVVSFDIEAALIYGEIMGVRKELGRPMSMPDGQIAAIARSRGLALATRNVADFEECGVEVVNPWDVL